METNKTKGENSFNNGFNLRKEIEKLLNNEKQIYKITKFHKSSPYQKNRYKPEFVGQEVWVKTAYSDVIVVTQDDFEHCKKINDFEMIILKFR